MRAAILEGLSSGGPSAIEAATALGLTDEKIQNNVLLNRDGFPSSVLKYIGTHFEVLSNQHKQSVLAILTEELLRRFPENQAAAAAAFKATGLKLEISDLGGWLRWLRWEDISLNDLYSLKHLIELGFIGPEIKTELLRLLDHDYTHIRAAAIRSLKALNVPYDEIKDKLDAIAHECTDVASAQHEDLYAAIVESYPKQNDLFTSSKPVIVKAALKALEQRPLLPEELSDPRFRELLRNRDEEIRRAAVGLIKKWNVDLSEVKNYLIPGIVNAVSETDQAIKTYVELNLPLDDEIKTALFQKLKCPWPDVVAAAIEACANYGISEIAETCKGYVNNKDADPAVRAAAVKALFAFNQLEATPAIHLLLKSEGPKIMKILVEGLLKMPASLDEIESVLLERFKEADPAVKAAALWGLAEIHRPRPAATAVKSPFPTAKPELELVMETGHGGGHGYESDKQVIFEELLDGRYLIIGTRMREEATHSGALAIYDLEESGNLICSIDGPIAKLQLFGNRFLIVRRGNPLDTELYDLKDAAGKFKRDDAFKEQIYPKNFRDVHYWEVFDDRYLAAKRIQSVIIYDSLHPQEPFAIVERSLNRNFRVLEDSYILMSGVENNVDVFDLKDNQSVPKIRLESTPLITSTGSWNDMHYALIGNRFLALGFDESDGHLTVYDLQSADPAKPFLEITQRVNGLQAIGDRYLAAGFPSHTDTELRVFDFKDAAGNWAANEQAVIQSVQCIPGGGRDCFPLQTVDGKQMLVKVGRSNLPVKLFDLSKEFPRVGSPDSWEFRTPVEFASQDYLSQSYLVVNNRFLVNVRIDFSKWVLELYDLKDGQGNLKTSLSQLNPPLASVPLNINYDLPRLWPIDNRHFSCEIPVVNERGVPVRKSLVFRIEENVLVPVAPGRDDEKDLSLLNQQLARLRAEESRLVHEIEAAARAADLFDTAI